MVEKLKMQRTDLESFLTEGKQLGFRNSVGNPDRYGWILLFKEQPHYRYLSLLEPGEEPGFVQEQKEIEEKPFVVLIIELEKTKHENPEFYEEFDVHQIHRFSDLNQIQAFLLQFDLQLEDIKWPIEIDAP